jgi:hypothetical protein
VIGPWAAIPNAEPPVSVDAEAGESGRTKASAVVSGMRRVRMTFP